MAAFFFSKIKTMEIFDFFSKFSSLYTYHHPVTYFTGKTYQSLFFEKVRNFIEQQTGDEIKKINLDQDVSEIQVQLSTTFLGQKSWYWLGNIGLLTSKKKRADYIKFIKQYQGPHQIIVFLPESDVEVIKDSLVVRIQEAYTKHQIKKISLLYQDQKPEVISYFFTKLYQIKKEYSLDQLCLYREYASLLGRNMEQFFDTWIEKLVVSDVSLFYLSQLFFEKSATEFFTKWQEIRSYYSDQFWTSYFSEQLFKAYFYVQHNGQIPTDQKQLLFGLPFSFLKHDWKLYQSRELQYAHQKIYEIDLSLKRSGSLYQLDSFFALFFNGTFS